MQHPIEKGGQSQAPAQPLHLGGQLLEADDGRVVAEDVVADRWDRAYSRETAAFPVVELRRSKCRWLHGWPREHTVHMRQEDWLEAL